MNQHINLTQTKSAYRNGTIPKQHYIEQMHDGYRVLFDIQRLMQGTDISKIEVTEQDVIMTVRSTGIRLLCDSVDQRTAPLEILNFDRYEELDSSIIRELLEPGQSVLDIGANIGWYALNLVRWFPELMVHAFEPVPQTFDYLRRNVSLNETAAIRIYDHGFSNTTEDKIIFFHPEGSGNASLANLSGKGGTQEVVCHFRTVDAFVEENRLTIDFIKCDVEGAELLVFQGAKRTLLTQKPIVFSEMLRKWARHFNYHPNQIIEFFSELGYLCFSSVGGSLQEVSAIDETTAETNFFFLHAEKHAKRIGFCCKAAVGVRPT